MRVPVFNQQINEAQTPSAQISGGLTPGQAVGAVSNQLDGLTGMVGTGVELYNQYLDTANKARVSQVTADYQNRLNNYIYNPTDGLLTIKGEKALKRDSGKTLVGEALEWFDVNAREQESILANGTQRKMFNENMVALKGQLGRIASQHLFDEGQKFQKQAFESEIDANVSSVSMNYSDIETTALSLEKILRTSQEYGKDLGWNDQQIEQFAKGQQDKAVLDAINLMQSNGEGSKIRAYFALTKGFLTTSSQAKAIKLIQDNNSDSLDRQLISLREKGDLKTLEDIADDLQKDESSLINAIGQRNITAALSKTLNYRNSIIQKKETDQVQRHNDAKTAVNDFKQFVLEGVPLSGDLIENVNLATKGTSSENIFKFWQQNIKNFQSFQIMDTSEQSKIINKIEIERARNPSNDPKTDGQLLNAYKAMYQTKLKNIKENPSLEAQKIGYVIPQINTSDIISDPQKFITSIVDVGKIHLAMRQLDINTEIKPINPADLPKARHQFENLNVNQKLNFIGSLIGQTQNLHGGRAIWQEVLNQLGSGDSKYVAAGTARLNNFRSTEGRDVAASIISGAQTLKNEQFVMPKDTDLRAAFNDYVGQTLSGTTANNAYGVFKAIYADTLVARGQLHVKPDDLPRNDIVKTALGMTTGGIYEQKGNFSNYMNGKYQTWKVTKPYGMADRQFEEKLNKGYADLSKQTGISVAELRGFRLRQGGSTSKNTIRYDLINERGAPLVKDGGVWWINVDKVTK